MKLIGNFFFMTLPLVLGFVSCAAQKGGPLTQTVIAQGKVQGVIENGLGVFKGIPYAKPPIGNLRWREPVPADSWNGVYVADTYKAMPPQETRTIPGHDKPLTSEDCLYLNILTPATSAEDNLPVMVWIHGGGFITGSALSPDGTQIAKRGIVYVSIEYRTGALGFLALPELSKESPRGISGNYGLMDQILALKWVKNNIARFGGNPDKVTIFGESAGAIAVSMLCASPLTKGLFVGAISESGGSFCPIDSVRNDNNGIRDLKGAEQFGLDFMRRMGAKSLDELRSMSPDKWISDSRTTGVGGFWPTVDGYVITDDQYKLYQKGEFNDVNVMIGTNSDEGSMFVRPTTVEAYQQLVRDSYGPYAEKVLALYPAATDAETFGALSDIFRETAFAWPSYAWAKLQKQKGKSKVYMYFFDQPMSFSFVPGTKPRGAGHASELGYVFGVQMFAPLIGNAKMLSDQMMQYWTNFAKTGDPNGEGLQEWPVFDERTKSVMYFKDGCSLIELPHKPQLDLMEDFFKWKRDNWKNR